MPVHLPRPNPVFSAKHVNGRLFGLKVFYLSSPPRQPAVMAPGPTHIRRPLSCLTCLALKEDPPTPNLFANVSTQQVRNGLTAVVERWEVKWRKGTNAFEALHENVLSVALLSCCSGLVGPR